MRAPTFSTRSFRKNNCLASTQAHHRIHWYERKKASQYDRIYTSTSLPGKTNRSHWRGRKRRFGRTPLKKGYRLSLDNVSDEIVQYLILATGYQNNQAFEFSNQLGRLKSHVLQASEIDSQPTTHFSGHVLVIGSGLTALDIWKRLEGNASVKITFLSRHGFLPLSHDPIAQCANIPQLAGMSPLQIVQVLRCVHHSRTGSWAAIADQVRSQAKKIWTCWTEVERKRFFRHLKSYWEVIRHRMPATLYQEVKNAITEKRLDVLAGRITRISEELGQIKITYNDRHDNVRRELWANWIFLATGFSVHQGLILQGEIPGVHQCPYGFGYINESAARLWTLGPSSKSTFWEITAIPDIRDQARTIAEAIARDQSQYQIAYVDKVSNGMRNLQPLLSKRRQRASANFQRT